MSEEVPSVRRRQKKRSKRGADLEESVDEEMNGRSDGTDELLGDNSRRKWNGKAEYDLIKR